MLRNNIYKEKRIFLGGSMSYIEIENLTKVIKNNIILDNINISIDKKQICGFIGKNGSGKTMLFRAISGLIKATQGQIIIEGKIISKDIDFPESCGLILESPGFWDNQTGIECLKNIASIKKVTNENEIKIWMIKFGLEPSDKRVFRKYSLGMKQKLALVQAFMESPDLIILDEPTNALDEESIVNLMKIIKEERNRGATILITSHNKDEINLLCDKVYKIDLGKVQEV